MESLLIIPLLFIKFTEILTLFDSISPFVDIVFKILHDIVFFLLIFCITIFMAANCFYLIGRNQIYFDEITVDEFTDTPIGYDTLRKAIWYTWLLTLGEFDYGTFWLGNQQSAFLLVFFFTASTFMMIIHLLNMLIAIIGNTYMSRNEVAHNIRSRDHLKFVIENWELNQYFENRDKLKYIVTAYRVKEL